MNDEMRVKNKARAFIDFLIRKIGLE